jgi:hypothetical protein
MAYFLIVPNVMRINLERFGMRGFSEGKSKASKHTQTMN